MRRIEFENQETRKEKNELKSGFRFWLSGFQIFYGSFVLICCAIASKSGHSCVASLEWISSPLTQISKAPPLDGMSRTFSTPATSRILAAKLTARGS
jgi:hypothetical protein